MYSPYVGGSLSNPVVWFLNFFGDWNFFKMYLYFLACAMPATFTTLAWVVTSLFLKEVGRLYISFLHHQAKVATRLFLTMFRSISWSWPSSTRNLPWRVYHLHLSCCMKCQGIRRWKNLERRTKHHCLYALSWYHTYSSQQENKEPSLWQTSHSEQCNHSSLLHQ